MASSPVSNRRGTKATKAEGSRKGSASATASASQRGTPKMKKQRTLSEMVPSSPLKRMPPQPSLARGSSHRDGYDTPVMSSPAEFKTVGGIRAGMKILNVRNMRKVAGIDVEEEDRKMKIYFEKAEERVSAAVKEVIFRSADGSGKTYIMERVYRDVEELVKDGRGEAIHSMLMDTLMRYLRAFAMFRIDQDSDGQGSVHEGRSLLERCLAEWRDWRSKTVDLRKMFGYLDRAYLLRLPVKESLGEECDKIWREALLSHCWAGEEHERGNPTAEYDEESDEEGRVVRPETSTNQETKEQQPVGVDKLYDEINALVASDRASTPRDSMWQSRRPVCRGETWICAGAEVDPARSAKITATIKFLRECGLYHHSWEVQFLTFSEQYFKRRAAEETATGMDLRGYIKLVASLLNKEEMCCYAHSCDTSTYAHLEKIAQRCLVENKVKFLTDADQVFALLKSSEGSEDRRTSTEANQEGISLISKWYRFFRTPSLTATLAPVFESYIKRRGRDINSAAEQRGERLVSKIIAFKSHASWLLDNFAREAALERALRAGFESFINDRAQLHPWGRGGAKVGELLARHVDLLLRGALSTYKPPSPESVAVARAPSEYFTPEEKKEMELDSQLEMAFDIFRYIDGKSTFMEVYKLLLAKRLLNNRILSLERERWMAEHMKGSSNSDEFEELETMLNDQVVGYESLTAWQETVERQKAKETRKDEEKDFELEVRMLSQSAWPDYPDMKDIAIPPTVAEDIEAFSDWYTSKNSAKRLEWRVGLSTASLRANFESGKKYIGCSALQACVLVLFNFTADEEALSFYQIQRSTNIPVAELTATLQSFIKKPFNLLLKSPKSALVADTDTFTLNIGFKHKNSRFRLPMFRMRDVKVAEIEVGEVKRSVKDREGEMQSTIVRMMKRAGRIYHQHLVEDTQAMMEEGGEVEAKDVKKCIDGLIDKEYLERDESEENVYLYIA